MAAGNPTNRSPGSRTFSKRSTASRWYMATRCRSLRTMARPPDGHSLCSAVSGKRLNRLCYVISINCVNPLCWVDLPSCRVTHVERVPQHTATAPFKGLSPTLYLTPDVFLVTINSDNCRHQLTPIAPAAAKHEPHPGVPPLVHPRGHRALVSAWPTPHVMPWPPACPRSPLAAQCPQTTQCACCPLLTSRPKLSMFPCCCALDSSQVCSGAGA